MRVASHIVIASLAVSLLSPGACAELRLTSWNIQHLGWDNDKSYEAVARVGARFDFIAIQETVGKCWKSGRWQLPGQWRFRVVSRYRVER